MRITLCLKPASYSKHKKVKEILVCLCLFPEQTTNTEKAYEYSVEFVEYLSEDTRVGTLSEFINENPTIDSFVLALQDGALFVQRKENKFIAQLL